MKSIPESRVFFCHICFLNKLTIQQQSLAFCDAKRRKGVEKECSTTNFSSNPQKYKLDCQLNHILRKRPNFASASAVIYKDSITRHHLFCRAAVVDIGQTSFWHIKKSYTWGIFKLDQFPKSSNHTDTEHSCTSNTEGVGWWQAALSSSDKFQQTSCSLKNKHQEMTDLAVLILFLVRYLEKSEQGWYGYKKKTKTKTHQIQVRIIKLKSALQHRLPTIFTHCTTEGQHRSSGSFSRWLENSWILKLRLWLTVWLSFAKPKHSCTVCYHRVLFSTSCSSTSCSLLLLLYVA